MNSIRAGLIAAGAATMLWGCVHKPYSATNRAYQKQAKHFAATLRAQSQLDTNDSIKAPGAFVGITNFTMRKPNFVIIPSHGANEL